MFTLILFVLVLCARVHNDGEQSVVNKWLGKRGTLLFCCCCGVGIVGVALVVVALLLMHVLFGASIMLLHVSNCVV